MCVCGVVVGGGVCGAPMKTKPCVIKFKSRGPKCHPWPPGGRGTIKGGEKTRKQEMRRKGGKGG